MASELPKDPLGMQKEFQSWVGLCITGWARLEDELFRTCWMALQSPIHAAAIVYYRTPTLDARMSLTNELVLLALPKRERKNGGKDHPDVATWRKLICEIDKAKMVRRQIAHHPVRYQTKTRAVREGRPPIDLPAETASWLEIYESDAERLRTGGKATPLTKTALERHAEKVMGLTAALGAFATNILPKHLG